MCLPMYRDPHSICIALVRETRNSDKADFKSEETNSEHMTAVCEIDDTDQRPRDHTGQLESSKGSRITRFID